MKISPPSKSEGFPPARYDGAVGVPPTPKAVVEQGEARTTRPRHRAEPFNFKNDAPLETCTLVRGAGRTPTKTRRKLCMKVAKCKECGQALEAWEKTRYETTPERHMSGAYCYFWTGWVLRAGYRFYDYRIARVDGRHYYIEDEICEGLHKVFRGFDGKRFVIEFSDGAVITETTNLWYQGKIPEHFKDRLPDNARFLGDEPVTQSQ